MQILHFDVNRFEGDVVKELFSSLPKMNALQVLLLNERDSLNYNEESKLFPDVAATIENCKSLKEINFNFQTYEATSDELAKILALGKEKIYLSFHMIIHFNFFPHFLKLQKQIIN